ncbi:hypothetical protein C8F04DRAFT_1184751 [Mycena alexandri]|uniref:Ribonuclease H1 N-terminal domain-containing protein n=1 Tax=Mycena alexandri TaxID=1745969 RepID=A0AAD6STJ2_9AGAR|nr:hypothetical protein C8F04DRAFT_1184751 [Mycena alexandri]
MAGNPQPGMARMKDEIAQAGMLGSKHTSLGCSVNHAWEGRLRSKSAGWGARESASWDGLGWWRKKKDVALIVFVCIESHWLRTSVDELRRGRRRYSTRRPHSFPPHNPTLSHEERRTVNSERHGFGQTRGITGEGAAGAGTRNQVFPVKMTQNKICEVISMVPVAYSESLTLIIFGLTSEIPRLNTPEPEQKAIALSKKLYHDFKEEPNWRQEQKCPSCFQTWHVSKGVERVVDCEQNPKQLNPVNFATGPTCRQPTKPVNVGWIEMSSSEKDERDRKKAQAKKEDKKASAKKESAMLGVSELRRVGIGREMGGTTYFSLSLLSKLFVVALRTENMSSPSTVLYFERVSSRPRLLNTSAGNSIPRDPPIVLGTDENPADSFIHICTRPRLQPPICCWFLLWAADVRSLINSYLKWRPLLNPTQTCRPHFFPDPGVEAASHSLKAKTRFYIVKSGRVEGIFTSHYMADEQVKEFSGQDSISTRTYAEALAVWAAHCGNSHHLHGGPCPDLGFNGQTTLWGVCGFHRTFTSSEEARQHCQLNNFPLTWVNQMRIIETPPEFATCPPVFFPTANTNAPVYYVVTKGPKPGIYTDNQSFTVRKEALRAWAQHCQTNHGRLCLIAGSKTYWAIKGLRAVFDSRESVLDHAEAVGLKTVHLYGHFDENLVKSFQLEFGKLWIKIIFLNGGLSPSHVLPAPSRLPLASDGLQVLYQPVQFVCTFRTLLKLVVEGLDLLVNK